MDYTGVIAQSLGPSQKLMQAFSEMDNADRVNSELDYILRLAHAVEANVRSGDRTGAADKAMALNKASLRFVSTLGFNPRAFSEGTISGKAHDRLWSASIDMFNALQSGDFEGVRAAADRAKDVMGYDKRGRGVRDKLTDIMVAAGTNNSSKVQKAISDFTAYLNELDPGIDG